MNNHHGVPCHQVGIVAVNLVGERVMPMQQQQPLQQQQNQPLQPAPISPAPALPPSPAWAAAPHGLDDVDAATAARLVEIHAAKAAAIAAEDYDEAKRLKAADDVLRRLGKQIRELEAAKASAVAAEDYDACKALKSQVDGLRNGAAYRAAFALQPLTAAPSVADAAVTRQPSQLHKPPTTPPALRVDTPPVQSHAVEMPCSPGNPSRTMQNT